MSCCPVIDQVMLFGASNSHSQDKIMQVTVAFNHFGQGLIQRMPRCRFGFFHVVNNDYTHWIMYAIGGNMNPTIISQGNRFLAPHTSSSKEVSTQLIDPRVYKYIATLIHQICAFTINILIGHKI
jgi:pectate lyase